MNKVGVYTREDLINHKFIDAVQRELGHCLGYNLVPMYNDSWTKDLARKKAHEVNQNRLLNGCEEHFIYARVSVDYTPFNEEESIERGLKEIVGIWMKKYEKQIRSKSGFMPHILLSSIDNPIRKDPEERTMTICMAAYLQ